MNINNSGSSGRYSGSSIQRHKKFPCFECEHGTMLPATEDFKTQAPELGKITVPNVPMHRCNHCDCCVIGDEGSQMIDTYIDQLVSENAISDHFC